MENSKKPGDLPLGWKRIVTERKSGKTKGFKDVYIIDPHGRRFRSKKELKRYLNSTESRLNLEDFDFSKTFKVINKVSKTTKIKEKKKSEPRVPRSENTFSPALEEGKCTLNPESTSAVATVSSTESSNDVGVHNIRKSVRKTRRSSKLDSGLFYSQNTDYKKFSCQKLVIRKDWQKKIDGETRVVAKTGAPAGWTKVLRKRMHGIYKGKFDVYIISPEGVQFRSRPELRAFLEDNKLNLSVKDFDMTSPLPVSAGSRKRLASQPPVGPPKKVHATVKSHGPKKQRKHLLRKSRQTTAGNKKAPTSHVKRKLKEKKKAQSGKDLVVARKVASKHDWRNRTKIFSIRKDWRTTINGTTRYIDKASQVPAGWSKVLQERKNGMLKGRNDVYIFSPEGVKFRSRPELEAFLRETNSALSINDFDMTNSTWSRRKSTRQSHVRPSKKKHLSVKSSGIKQMEKKGSLGYRKKKCTTKIKAKEKQHSKKKKSKKEDLVQLEGGELEDTEESSTDINQSDISVYVSANESPTISSAKQKRKRRSTSHEMEELGKSSKRKRACNEEQDCLENCILNASRDDDDLDDSQTESEEDQKYLTGQLMDA
jgi:hypothetical protein